MAKVDIYKVDGSKTGVMELPDHLFAVTADSTVVAEAVRIQDANSRCVYASTKDRSEVRGGGRKPWKQKGTGRARHGSRRSPIWVGGGITFGPTTLRNFALKINKKAKRKALAGVLSDRLNEGRLIVVDQFDQDGLTKNVAQMRRALPGSDSSAVVVSSNEDKAVVRGVRNLPKTGVLSAQSMNVRDLLRYQYIIASKAAVEKMIEVYA
jgi:large subunit ribosomal protein L4